MSDAIDALRFLTEGNPKFDACQNCEQLRWQFTAVPEAHHNTAYLMRSCGFCGRTEGLYDKGWKNLCMNYGGRGAQIVDTKRRSEAEES